MRGLKGVLLIVLVMALIVGLVVPAMWFFAASSLPYQLESAQDIELQLRQSIESERLGQQLPKRIQERGDVKWPRPDFTQLPKNLVALYVTETGCPTYFDSPKEEHFAWNKRVAFSVMDSQLDGDGACELIFARRLARRLGAKSSLQVAVAADRIHAFLKKDELVSFDLQSMPFDQGVLGVDAASQMLFHEKVLDLNLGGLAELQLAIPPHGYWKDVFQCSNGSLLRQSRDAILDRLARMGHVTPEVAATASAQPMKCLSVKR